MEKDSCEITRNWCNHATGEEHVHDHAAEAALEKLSDAELLELQKAIREELDKLICDFNTVIGERLLIMRKHLSCISIALILCFSTTAQIPNIRIGPKKVAGYQPCEPSIAISQTDPNIIVAGSILDNVYRSEDGGVSWSHQKLISSHGVFGDPCVVITAWRFLLLTS